jgi:RHS repeat-associated protein
LSFDGAGTQTHRYFYGTGVDQVFVDENAQGRVLWTLTDNQGTVRDLIDSAGAIQNHITYDSFGKITSQTNSSITTIFGYTGREYDGETEQYYYRARYYDQNIGRFVSEDPIGFAAGDPNIYRYVGNSPTNFVDPLGLECECSSATSNIDYGTVAAEGAKSAAIGLATVAGVGLAVGAGVISAPAVAVIGGALLLYSAGSSLFCRSEQARASGNNNLGEIAGATALDTFGFGGLVEGVRGRELVTGRCLNGNERSRGIGQGIGNAVTLAGGSKVFKSAYSEAYPFRGVPQGLTKGQFGDAADIIRASKAGQYSDDIVVQGSRANGTARPNSDIDFGVRAPEDKFNQILNDRFGTPNPGSAKERTLQNAIETGKIQSGEAGLRPLRKQLVKSIGDRCRYFSD